MRIDLESVLFALGDITVSAKASAALSEANQSPVELLHRHERGDWGEIDDHEWDENNDCLDEGFTLTSAYLLSTGRRIVVITTADRRMTMLITDDEPMSEDASAGK